LRHATPARRDTFLQAAANFLPDPESPGSVPLDLRVALHLASCHMPLLPSLDRFHYAIFLRGHLMLLYGLHHSWIGLSLCRFVASFISVINALTMDLIFAWLAFIISSIVPLKSSWFSFSVSLRSFLDDFGIGLHFDLVGAHSFRLFLHVFFHTGFHSD
jgi:hypothetical protein